MTRDFIKIESENINVDEKSAIQLNKTFIKLSSNLGLANFNLKLIKNNHIIEGLLWCSKDQFSIGAYSKSNSVEVLMHRLVKKITKECRIVNKHYLQLNNNVANKKVS